MPTAKKKATRETTSRAVENLGATAAPMATYDRCQAVYGGWSSVR
jgi:hypothetical protein